MLTLKCRFINRYAFSHIALYGKAYIPAAKDTWTMMKNRGIDALVNDCLIGPVLTMVSYFFQIDVPVRIGRYDWTDIGSRDAPDKFRGSQT